ncbi:MAG: hypothetical protein M3033_19020, partial [Acidobacteriota bacterium]|nr:hypothetical protein [Acidobacteriota bacterium]
MLNTIRENIERRFGISSAKTETANLAAIERATEFSGRYKNWRANENLNDYPFVENVHAPFAP